MMPAAAGLPQDGTAHGGRPNTVAGAPQDPDDAEEYYTDDEDEDEDDEDDEPILKYQRLGGNLSDIIANDQVSCMCAHVKLLVR